MRYPAGTRSFELSADDSIICFLSLLFFWVPCMTQRLLRALLIVPGATLPIDTRTSPQLGVAYLGAVSEARGDRVLVYDGNVEDASLEAVLRDYEPDLVGITANTTQIKGAWRDAAIVKAWRDVPVVLGGPHPTVLPDESLYRGDVDVVARGEGELTWRALSDLLSGEWAPGTPFRSPDSRLWAAQAPALGRIGGISYRLPDGRAAHNADRPPMADLDSLPLPAYHLLRMDRYTNLQPTLDHVQGPSLAIMTSRGCPYRCSYCAQIMPRQWRMRSAQSVVDEWRWLVEEKGAAEIGVLDDSFNIDRQRVLDICDLLIERGLNRVPWIMINGIRANLADEELLGRMRQAGCIRTAFGVESGNQAILDSVIDKHLTLDQIRARVQGGQGGGHGDYRLLHYRPARRDRADDGRHHPLRLRAGSRSWPISPSPRPSPAPTCSDTVQAEGPPAGRRTGMITSFFEGKARFEMDGLPAELVERKWKEAYRRFYLRPSRVARTLTPQRNLARPAANPAHGLAHGRCVLRDHGQSPVDTIQCSVGITAYNEEANIGQLLTALREQRLLPGGDRRDHRRRQRLHRPHGGDRPGSMPPRTRASSSSCQERREGKTSAINLFLQAGPERDLRPGERRYPAPRDTIENMVRHVRRPGRRHGGRAEGAGQYPRPGRRLPVAPAPEDGTPVVPGNPAPGRADRLPQSLRGHPARRGDGRGVRRGAGHPARACRSATRPTPWSTTWGRRRWPTSSASGGATTPAISI